MRGVSPDRARPRPGTRSSLPRRALWQHVAAVTAAMLVVTVVVGWLINERAADQADAAAADQVRTTAEALALPLTDVDIRGDRDWVAALEAATDPQLATDEIVTVHLWGRLDSSTGEILWSSDPERIGSAVPLGGAAEALDTGEPYIERLDDGTDSEGPPLPNLYEIYYPFTDVTGTDYVLEIYKPVMEYDGIRASLLRDWLPITILSTLAVGLVTLSLRLARGVATAEQERALYADRALRARAEEHQRMSEILHERTVQDLSTIRLILDAVRDLPASDEVNRALTQTTDLLATDVHELRELLTSGEATEWQADELAVALRGWATTLPDSARISYDLPGEPLLLADPDVALAFRVIKEAVRNAVKHSEARSILVRVVENAADPEQPALEIEVGDDGRGFDATATPGLGLRIIRHATAAAGGEVDVESVPGLGTTIRVTLPHRP